MNVRTSYYNSAPRGVQSKDQEVVREEIEKRTKDQVENEDAEIPKRLQRNLAGRILDIYIR